MTRAEECGLEAYPIESHEMHDDMYRQRNAYVKGYEKGISYRDLSSAMPYMYSDAPENIDFIADAQIIDQIIDWFGTDIEIRKTDDEAKVKVSVKASPTAMTFWALQYVDHVELVRPDSLRERIRTALENGLKKYQ